MPQVLPITSCTGQNYKRRLSAANIRHVQQRFSQTPLTLRGKGWFLIPQ